MDNVTVNINELLFTIKEASFEDIRKQGERDDEALLFGICDYISMEILIANTLSVEQKRRTLRHELTHAFVFAYGFLYVSEKMKIESVCEFIGAYGGEIERIVQKVYP